MSCAIEQRNKVRRTVEHLQQVPDVQSAHVREPHTHPEHTWALEATVEGDSVPTSVLRALAVHGLALDPDRTGARTAPAQTVVVART
jgi:tryptophan 2,3-dioxygenase